jgi:hypothetical protein
MNKRGQYYLVTAIVLVTIILSFATITNSVQKRAEKERVYDLYSEINLDTKKVANFNIGQGQGVCQQVDAYCRPEMELLLKNLNEVYPGIEKKIYFITIPLASQDPPVVDTSKIKPYFYTVDSGITEAVSNVLIIKYENRISVTLDGKIYYFDYDYTKNSYILIIQEIDNGETEDQYTLRG